MRPKLRVDDIMSRPVFTIGEDRTTEDALREMERNGIKKILVVSKDNDPRGVLERWKITSLDRQKKVKDLELTSPLFVSEGTELPTIEAQLAGYPAVYVHDSKDKKKLVGVVTGYDLMKAY